MSNQGYIHLYTGNGKGKTTAALGLALRALGAGKRIFIGQFVKGMPYAEEKALVRFPEITIKKFGRNCFIENEPTQEDISTACEGLSEIAQLVPSGEYDMIVLDEICIALHFKLFKTEEVLNILANRTSHLEIVLTGRYAPDALYEVADLVTEMKEIKHYYKTGVQARKGIEF
jgi:cob(I)alamin adenosyltransferase